MLLIDVNVLVYANRPDSPRHSEFKAWTDRTLRSPEPVGVPDLVLSALLRIITHPGIFRSPTPTDKALEIIQTIRDAENVIRTVPSDRHWGIFIQLCRTVGATGNVVPDAYLAALAIDSGGEWITTDRGYGRFPGLRWRHPLD